MKAVLVTTEFRGVFFGYLNGMPETLPNSVTLANARNCLYWDESIKGFLGLATQGPTSSCRIGPKVENLTLYKITSIAPCTSDAEDSWENAPWK